MKKFLKHIIWVLFVFNIAVTNAAEITFEESPEDNVEQGLQKRERKRKYNISEKALLLARYFNNHYKGDKIEEEFSDEVSEFFPNFSQQEVYDAEKWIRRLVKLYRKGVEIYDEFVSALATSQTPRLFTEEDYEKEDGSEYIDTGNDKEYVVIIDIKRVLSYGNNIQDAELMQAKEDHDKGIKRKSAFEIIKELKTLWDKGRYKELFFFGDDNEEEEVAGAGEIDDKGIVSAGLISNLRGTAKPERLHIGLHVVVPLGRFVAAENSGKYYTPAIDVNNSENIDSYNVRLPVPLRFNHSSGVSLGVYTGSFLIPIEINIKDANYPIKLQTHTRLYVCDYTLDCQEVELENAISLNNKDYFPSNFDVFVEQGFSHLPKTTSKEYSLDKAVVDVDENKNESIRLEFIIKSKFSHFDVFIENEDKTLFNAPIISYRRNRVFVRFDPVEKGVSLLNKKLLVRSMLNRKYALQKEVKIEQQSIFDPRATVFSVGILVLAFLGGIILNFMPCVLPVLAMKITALSTLKGLKSEEIKRSMRLSVLGIFGGFFILASILAIIKMIGYSLGWGMQFQSYWFLGIMMFVIMLFSCQLQNYVDIKTPDFINKYLSSNIKRTDFLSVITGAFVVLMATPCSAPFLGVAVGFALAGKVIHIYAVLSAIALGLSLPYIIILLIPKVSVKIPKDEKWQRRYILFMQLMLLLTLVWLFSILAAQIGFFRAFIFTFLLFAVLFFIVLRKKFIDFIYEHEKDNKEDLQAVKAFFGILVLLLSFVCYGYLYFAHHASNEEFLARNISEHINIDEIRNKVAEGKTVLLEVGADWCLTCKLNDLTVLNYVRKYADELNLVYIQVDWSRYNEDVLNFMAKYGRRGLPFYVIYNKTVPDGIALPEILSVSEMEDIIGNSIMR